MYSLDQQLSYLSVTDDDMDDCRSECSYYSLPELDETDSVRRIPRSVVKQQAEVVTTCSQVHSKYPHAYHNSERLPLRVAGPWLEHPLMSHGPYSSGYPGPARVVISAMGGRGYDVIYHPNRPSPWGHKKNTFAQARYHPKGSRRSNMPAHYQHLGQSPWGLASSIIQPPFRHHYLSPPDAGPFQSPGGAYTLQPTVIDALPLAIQQNASQQHAFNSEQYSDLQQYLDMQKWLETQPFSDTQQHLAAQQPITTQQYFNTQKCHSQPYPYWNDYGSQVVTSDPLIQPGGPMNYV